MSFRNGACYWGASVGYEGGVLARVLCAIEGKVGGVLVWVTWVALFTLKEMPVWYARQYRGLAYYFSNFLLKLSGN